MENKLYLGIDPGKNGGIAGIFNSTQDFEDIIFYRCPESSEEMYKCLESLIFEGTDNYKVDQISLAIEHVHSFPKQGVVSTFSFGQNFGRWEGVISSFEIDKLDVVSPQKWMKYYDVPKGLTRKDRKRYLMDIARELYPDKKITYNVSDAILIANYCKEITRRENGNNT